MSIADIERHEMWRPESLAALTEKLAERHAAGQKTVLLAGGTDWVVEQEMAKASAPEAPLPLVADISRLEELRGISFKENTLRIGAATTYLELRRHPEIGQGTRRAELFARMAQDLGALQIQARGTLGGNLATGSPAADGVTVLAAFDATVVLTSVRGERRVAMLDYQTGYKKSAKAPDELIVAFEVNVPQRYSWYWRKVGTRRAQAISKVALSGMAVLENGRITRVGLGMASVAPVTALLLKTRGVLLSAPIAEIAAPDLEAAVLTDIAPIDDIRSTREYRAHCARILVKEFARSLGAKI